MPDKQLRCLGFTHLYDDLVRHSDRLTDLLGHGSSRRFGVHLEQEWQVVQQIRNMLRACIRTLPNLEEQQHRQFQSGQIESVPTLIPHRRHCN